MSAFTETFHGAKAQTAVTLVRPLGGMERMFYRFAERNPAHFSLVAEFDIVLAEDQLRAALLAVQQRPDDGVHDGDEQAHHAEARPGLEGVG